MRCTGNRRAEGFPTSDARHLVQAENSPKPDIGAMSPAVLCRFWIADQMLEMTDRGVPMQSSSQDRALSVFVDIGRMRPTAFQAMAHVITTAQLAQYLAREEA
jgi:hypothetical protein